MCENPNFHPIFGEIISIYTRADALADGTLPDVIGRTWEMIRQEASAEHISQ